MALAVVLPHRSRRLLAGVVGAVLGVLVVLKALDVGFYAELNRPFNPVDDRGSFGPAIGVLGDSIGRTWAHLLVALALLLVVGTVALVDLSVLRVVESSARHRQGAVRAAGSLGVAWLVSALLSVQLVTGDPLASAGAIGLAADEVQTAEAAIHDQQVFTNTLSGPDPAARIPVSDLLSGLRGKDVIVAFVESYGQVAVQGTSFSPSVDAVLRQSTATLRVAGYHTRSAFLTSPTFGGISWLAHSTLQSGLWVDSQQRYDALLRSNRSTLSSAFERAGWQTVSDVPSDTGDWPEGRAFYHFDRMYNSENVGYAGPRFSYARVPDQYTLAAFRRLELAPHHVPVMAEIDLDSSHTPWSPIPRFLPWSRIGDGSVYGDLPPVGEPPSVVWRHSSQVKEMYGRSIQYSLRSLVSFVTRARDKNLVVVMLGDHQPATTVSGSDADFDVPITVIAHDRAVMARIAAWHWQRGMLPGARAPVERMDAFRDRFLRAFSTPSRAFSLTSSHPAG
jgi:hypothetical protein